MNKQDLYSVIAELLDSIDVAICVFDREDHTLLWNATFLHFFPEHAGRVHPGESYRANLERFYLGRLPQEERDSIERYIDEGVDRHRQQTRPFTFTHRGRYLRVGSLPLPDGDRIRVWQEMGRDIGQVENPPGWTEFPIDLLEYLADGAMVLDKHDRIIATNREFRILYDVDPERSVIGCTLHDLVQESWVRAGAPERARQFNMLERMRFAGVPFEVELPGGRWRRVIAHRTARGIGYFTHSDITPLKQAVSDLSAIAATDSLTGLANRRHFDQVFDEEWRRRQRDGTLIGLLLIDVDHFKQVNDQYGHMVGDACLRRVAHVIRGALLRSGDVAARHGGEEFAVVLPNTALRQALTVADNIRRAVMSKQLKKKSTGEILGRVTISVGVSMLQPGDDRDRLIERADACLYAAKRNGRNRVICEADPEYSPVDRIQVA